MESSTSIAAAGAATPRPFADRVAKVRERLHELGVDALVVSVGADLPWMIGYEAMPLERLTALVVTPDGPATLIVPALEAPRVRHDPSLFDMRPWSETENPIDVLARRLPKRGTIAIGDRMWSGFLVDLLADRPRLDLRRGSVVTGPLRAVKDDHEIAMLARAAAAVDRIAADLQGGAIPLVGRTEAQVSADLSRRIIDEGHERTNFAIVATGANAASPHHEPGDERIRAGVGLLCDFGGTMRDELGVGYCSDITRCVWLGAPPDRAAEAYGALVDAQAAGVAAAVVGTRCETVDAVTRGRLDEAGWGEWFIHRTGHGIGVEEHEDPYIVEGNREALVAGHAFSIEPGIYVPDEFGFRLEDIVVATNDGPRALNRADRALALLDR